jgi:uncharacterized membrane protein
VVHYSLRLHSADHGHCHGLSRRLAAHHSLARAFAGLYALAGICWLPVVWLQIRMAAMATQAHSQSQALPPLFRQYQLRWEALGYPAFVAMAGTYYLMVNKPALWG